MPEFPGLVNTGNVITAGVVWCTVQQCQIEMDPPPHPILPHSIRTWHRRPLLLSNNCVAASVPLRTLILVATSVTKRLLPSLPSLQGGSSTSFFGLSTSESLHWEGGWGGAEECVVTVCSPEVKPSRCGSATETFFFTSREDAAGGILKRHHWTPPKWLGCNAGSASVGSLPAI